MENGKSNKPHSLSVLSRASGSVSGVEKVISSCDTSLSLATSAGGMIISGNGLKIVKFSVDDGTLAFEGTVNNIKYSAAKAPLIKRIFK